MNCVTKHRQVLGTQWLKSFARIALCTLALLATSKIFAQSTSAGNAQDVAHVRLDAHPTTDNSVLFTFDNGGPTMRLPKVLFNATTLPKDPKQALEFNSVELAFWYPDMTLSDWSSTLAKSFQKQHGEYTPEKDRFRVHILWLYYANPNWDDLLPGKRAPFVHDPRPPRLDMNRHCIPFGDPHCLSEMQRFDSGFSGVDMQVAKDWLKDHPGVIEEKRRHPDTATYLAKLESPYELFMDCESIECTAYVYSKTYHLQYRMYFASEAVAHTDELIKAIDQMLARWSEK